MQLREGVGTMTREEDEREAVWQKETQRKLYSVLLIKKTTLFLSSLVVQGSQSCFLVFLFFFADAKP